jgi:hypothetical protein
MRMKLGKIGQEERRSPDWSSGKAQKYCGKAMNQ